MTSKGSSSIEKRVRSIVGTDGLCRTDAQGGVGVSPRSEAECSLLLAAASDHGWQVRFQGHGGWSAPDTPADLAIDTTALVGITDLSPADMVLTALAGTRMKELQAAAAREGTWVPLDPPGTNRSLGSVLATGTAGPLRTGYGAVRARILGLTFITPDGRILRVGGRVVKNVAGFDLSSLAVGSFGAFGLITSAHVRLGALPAADVTLVANSYRNDLLEGVRAILSSGLTPAALELISPNTAAQDAWTLICRIVGSIAAVAVDSKKAAETVPKLGLDAIEPKDAGRFWDSFSDNATRHSATVRVGCLPSEIETALDLLGEELDNGVGTNVSASILPGVIRWSSNAAVEQLQSLRQRAAGFNWPVTLERAPWETRAELGHYGAYRDGSGRLVHSLQEVFDKRGILNVPLSGAA